MNTNAGEFLVGPVGLGLALPFCRVPDAVTEQARRAIAAVRGVKEVRITRIDEPWKLS